MKQVSRGATHLDDLDLNPLLVQVDTDSPVVYKPNRREPVPDTLDAQILRDAEPFFERGEKMQLEYGVQNTMRAIGARSSSRITRKFGMQSLPEGRLHIRLEGSAGQSLGAFSVQGLLLEVLGDANDYVGKGLSGATIVVTPRPRDRRSAIGDAIIGNTCLYGATSGYLFASGQAGERFAVRNSGATAVIEGCGSNGCEYMTGGTVVILGEVGANFAAGMTGGMAFVYDPVGDLARRINPEAVVWRRVGSSYWRTLLEDLVEQHLLRTGSPRAKAIMDHFDEAVGDFWQVVPKEMIKRLAQPLDDAA